MQRLAACAILLVTWLAPSAASAQTNCEPARRVYQESMALYKRGSDLATGRGGDSAHLVNAQNHYNLWQACLRSRPSGASAGSGATTGYGRGAAALGAVNNFLGTVLEQMQAQRAREDAREEALRQEAELEQAQRDLQRAREDQGRLAADSLREQQQRAERQAALNADQQARCARPNPFGTASGCDGATTVAVNPFSSGNAGAGAGAGVGGRFADSSLRSAQLDPTQASVRAPYGYDSVRKVNCPEIIGPNCVADHVREGFAQLAKHGNRIPKYVAPDYSSAVVPAAEFERLGRGGAPRAFDAETPGTWSAQDVARALTDLERALSAVARSPEDARIIRALRPSEPEGQPVSSNTSVPWSKPGDPEPRDTNGVPWSTPEGARTGAPQGSAASRKRQADELREQLELHLLALPPALRVDAMETMAMLVKGMAGLERTEPGITRRMLQSHLQKEALRRAANRPRPGQVGFADLKLYDLDIPAERREFERRGGDGAGATSAGSAAGSGGGVVVDLRSPEERALSRRWLKEREIAQEIAGELRIPAKPMMNLNYACGVAIDSIKSVERLMDRAWAEYIHGVDCERALAQQKAAGK